MVGARGFEPPASWSQTRTTVYLLLKIRRAMQALCSVYSASESLPPVQHTNIYAVLSLCGG